MHVETYQGIEIIPITTHGDLRLYRRPEYRDLQCPKYVIFRGDIAVADPRNMCEAIKWMRDNKLPTKKIHVVVTVRPNNVEGEDDVYVDPIGSYDNLGDASVLAERVQKREAIRGIDYSLLGDFTKAVVISLPLNDHIRHN